MKMIITKTITFFGLLSILFSSLTFTSAESMEALNNHHDQKVNEQKNVKGNFLRQRKLQVVNNKERFIKEKGLNDNFKSKADFNQKDQRLLSSVVHDDVPLKDSAQAHSEKRLLNSDYYRRYGYRRPYYYRDWYYRRPWRRYGWRYPYGYRPWRYGGYDRYDRDDRYDRFERRRRDDDEDEDDD